MSRGSHAWFVTLILAAGCRGGEVATTDAAVDHRYTPTSDLPAEAPRVEPPTAIGGGPTNDENVYSSSGALNVLTSAWCEREKACGAAASDCEAEAARTHGEELARCVKGVDTSILSDCARQIRTASCESTPAIAETCMAAVLCVHE